MPGCRVCGKPLKNILSKHLGIGPECRKKLKRGDATAKKLPVFLIEVKGNRRFWEYRGVDKAMVTIEIDEEGRIARCSKHKGILPCRHMKAVAAADKERFPDSQILKGK